MENKIEHRGGVRPGSGRKRNPSAKIIICVKMPVVDKLGGKDAVKLICQEAVEMAMLGE